MKKYLDLGCVFLMALCLALLALGLATPVSARAQTPPPPGAPSSGGPEMGPSSEAVLMDVLALTDAQLASLKALQETRMQTVQAFMP